MFFHEFGILTEFGRMDEPSLWAYYYYRPISVMSSIHTVIVHPIVLLGITDHVKRMSKVSKGRVVGVLLGSCNAGVVDCTTSFASKCLCFLFIG